MTAATTAQIRNIQDGGAVTVEFGDLTYTGPAFVARNLTASLLDSATDFEEVTQQIAFLTVAALSRAAWIAKPGNPEQRADREFALAAIESGEPILLGCNWERLLMCLGCTPERFALVLRRWQHAKETAADRRAEEIERRAAEVKAIWDHAKVFAATAE